MAPLPKRKHSTARKGRRIRERNIKFAQLVTCSNCHKKKLPHQVCKYCQK